MKRVYLRGNVREMATATVSQLIGTGMMARIQSVDPNPFFFELTLAHEGESRGEIVGIGARVKEWGKRMIRAVAHAFKPAGRTPAQIYDGFYDWHGNEDSRLPVGEVLHSRVQELNGIEQVQAIGYIFPEQADLRTAINNGDRDCCSIEADVVTHEEGGRFVVDAVERGTAVVLGHTSKQMPGFPGAVVRRLAEFGPIEGATGGEGTVASEGAASSSNAAAGGQAQNAAPQTAATAAPAAAAQLTPATAPVLPGAQTLPLDRTAVLNLAKQIGITAADFSPLPVIHQSVPSPSAQPTSTQGSGEPDLTSAQWNQFLPE